MKKHLRSFAGKSARIVSLAMLSCCLGMADLSAQEVTDPSVNTPGYDNQKSQQAEMLRKSGGKDGAMLQQPGASARMAGRQVTGTAPVPSQIITDCFIPRDGSYTAIPRNDDGSYGPISLPFTFDLYGTSYNQVWINTNGNLTFTGAYSPFSASGFPFSVPMVAAFWADVDTRPAASGMIYFKVNPSNMIVTWDNVGYYSNATDKKNTFQAIIGTYADALTGVGQNVSLRYKDMQWTTGSASSGSGGFGGIAATVGVNQGNSTDYVQVGRFNLNNANYDGPGGANDGINYLDGQCFSFNVTNAGNIPPSANGLPTGNVLNLTCGQTATISPQFLAPEVNQSVTVSVNTGGLCNTAVSTNNGTTATANVTITASACNSGTHQIIFTATDNGNPAETTTSVVTVHIGTCCNMQASVAATNVNCYGAANGSIDLSVSNFTAPLSYAWSNGAISQDLSNLAPGTYSVTITDANGCTATANATITQPANVTPVANNDQLTAPACQSFTFSAAQLLANDTDPQSTALEIADVLQPSNGTITDNGNGTYTFTPSAGFSGNVTFNYVVKKNDPMVAYNGNGHFYEYVSSPYICWNTAKTEAEGRSYFGMQGYLATITSAGENAFAASKLEGNGWIGGSDSQAEGVWKWMTGPEAGQQFWQGLWYGYATAYHNWAGGEPNDAGGEDYAHFYAGVGNWNDLPNCHSWIMGYVVEYGGMESCTPQLTATATVTLQVTAPAPITVNTNNISVVLNASGNASISAAQINNGSYSSCGIASVSVSPSSFTCANTGQNTVTLTVTDNFGQTATGTATVNVIDNTAPVAIAQNVTVQLGANGTASVTAAQVNNGSSDVCGIASMTVSPSTFSCANVGSNTVTLTVTDNNGKVSTASAIVTVQDNIAPTVACAGDVNVTTAPAAGSASVTITGQNTTFYGGGPVYNFADPLPAGSIITGATINYTVYYPYSCCVAANDLFVAGTHVSSAYPGAPAGNKNYTLTYTGALPNYNYGGTNTFQVNTWWNAVRVVSATITLHYGSAATCGATVSVPAPTSSDNCGIASVTNDFNGTANASGYYPVGTTTVNWTIVDNNGLSATCQQNVTVTDVTAPAVVTQNITVQLDAAGNASISAADVNNGSSDACGIAGMSVSPASFSCANVGANSVTLTVTDNHGNTATANATVTVQDNVAPVAATQNLTIQLDANGFASVTAAQINHGSSDACGIASLALSQTSFTCANVGPNPVTLTVTDNNGNTSTATSTVTVEDNVAPVALAQNITVQLNASGAASITANQINNGSSDACGIASMTVTPSNFSCSNVGGNVVTLTVTDNNGNVSTSTATVTVEDNVAPVALAQNITVQLDAAGTVSIATADVNNGSSDACGIASMTVSPNSFSCANVGENVVTLTVTDNNGNVSSATATVTVEDNVAPIALAQNVTVQLDAFGQASTTPAAVNNGSSDACGIASLALSRTNFSCADLGANAVVLTVTDNNGNASTASATVTVEDNIVPSIACNGDISVVAQPGDCTPAVSWSAPVASDNCSYTVSSTHNSGDRFPVGTTTVTYTVTDAAGNSASCSFNVTVTPTPVVMSLASPTFAGGFNISCNGGSNGSATATVNGGCLPYSYLWSNGQTSATATGLTAGTYNVTVTDANGTSVNQSITLTEPTQLTVTGGITPATAYATAQVNTIYLGYGPQSRTLSTSVSGGVAAYSYNWSPATGLNSTSAASVVASPTASTTYVVTVTDANGCTATNSYAISVIDARCGNNPNNPKVIVCHNGNEICISPSAVPAHLAHGCQVGPCGNARVTEAAALISEPVLNVYPNPNNGQFTLEIEAATKGQIILELFDMSGRNLGQLFDGTVQAGEHRIIEVNQTKLASGIYMVKMQASGKTTNLRIAVQ